MLPRSVAAVRGARDPPGATTQSKRKMKIGHRVVEQRYYQMLGFGSFESASRFCAAFDELRQYFRVHRRGEGHVSLAEQRRLFLTRWRLLISELSAA